MGYNPFNDCNYSGLHAICQSVQEVPAFVKEAAVIDEQPLQDLPFAQFGDPGKRLYPLNNKSNTWLSREYFRKDRPTYNHKEASLVEERINKAASFWKLDEPAYIRHDPYKDMMYGIDVKDNVERTVFTVNLCTPEMFKTAAEELYKNRASYTYSMRKSLATGLLNAPERLQAGFDNEDLSNYIQKTAGVGSCTSNNVVQALYKRACCVRTAHPDVYRTLMIAAHDFTEAPAGFLPAAELEKVAELIDVVDRGCGFNVEYGKDFETPEEELFEITARMMHKIAEDGLTLSNGTLMSRTELVASRDRVNKFFQEHMGEIPYKDDEEMADVVGSLARPDADAFENYVGAGNAGDAEKVQD